MGTTAYLHVSQVGIVGRAKVASNWRPWDPTERRLLPDGAPSLETGGGFDLQESELFDEPIALTAASERPFTHDVQTLHPEEAARADARMRRAGEGPGYCSDARLAIDALGDDAAWIVIDEEVGDVITLEISPWPHLDERGLWFPPGSRRVDVRAESVWPVFAEAVDPNSTRARSSAAGGVFGARLQWDRLDSVDPDDGPLVDLRDLVHGPVIDVTERGREAAEVTFFHAIGADLRVEEPDRLLRDDDEEDR